RSAGWRWISPRFGQHVHPWRRPRISGHTRDGRKYREIAAAAAQHVTRPDVPRLISVRGKLETRDRSAIDLAAVSGVDGANAEMLRLSHQIEASSSNGELLQ